jgi:PAS domain S-box-containing protein
MNIDLRTLILVLGITNILQVIAISFQYQLNKSYRGVGWWLLAFLAIAVGFIFSLLREVISFDLITIITSSALTISGPIFIYIGVMRFLGRKERRWLVIGAYITFLLPYLYFTYVHNDINIRSLVSSLIVASFSLLTAQQLFAHKPNTITASATFLSTAWFIQGCFFALRAVVLLTASPVHTYFTPTLMQASTYLFILIVSTLVTFGLIIMINQRSNAETREAKEQFELIFHTSPDAALVTRANDGIIVDVNEGFTALSGFTRDEAIGKSILDINIYKNPADRQKIIEILTAKGFCENYEALFQRKDGSQLTGVMSAKIFPLQDIPHIISITRDISERAREDEQIRQLNADLEQRVALRTAHLQAANKEIASFTYSISHTLRSPLRAIAGFSQFLMEGYHTQLDAEGQRLLGVIQKNAYTMHELIDDILMLMRVSQVNLKISNIDMTSMVESVYRQTATANDQEKFTFTVAPLPQADGDATLMSLVWSNLISNAIKYTLPKDERSIQIGSQIEGDNNIYFIKDSGVGFNPNFTHKLFGLFERLHKEDQFDGTGMGLAIVQRTIQRHGGRVWAESVLDHGATFYFSIPRTQVGHE